MKKVFSVIWKIIAVAMIFAGIYLLVQVMGDADSVVEQYEQLTGNSIGATNSMKIMFLREYVQRTGNTEVLFTLGISSEEASIILKDDLTPEESADGEDDRQNPDGSPVSPTNPPSNNPTPAEGENPDINYKPVSANGLMQGGSAHFAKIKGTGGSSINGAGCALLAMYNAYYYNSSSPKHFEDIILECYPNLVVNANGYLEGSIDKIGEGGKMFNYINSNYTHAGSVVYNNASDDGSIKVNDKITSDGKYIIYYDHCDNKICNGKDGHSHAHWVYAERTGGTYKVYNPAGQEGDSIGSKPIIRYYKVG